MEIVDFECTESYSFFFLAPLKLYTEKVCRPEFGTNVEDKN